VRKIKEIKPKPNIIGEGQKQGTVGWIQKSRTTEKSNRNSFPQVIFWKKINRGAHTRSIAGRKRCFLNGIVY
jgi:hypothetical protein